MPAAAPPTSSPARGCRSGASWSLFSAARATTAATDSWWPGCSRPMGRGGSDGGRIFGPSVRATLTVTFGGYKRSLLLYPAAEHAGRIVVASIGIPDREVRRGIATFLLDEASVREFFPKRKPDAHKGTFGHLVVVAGAPWHRGPAGFARAPRPPTRVSPLTPPAPAPPPPPPLAFSH